MFNIIGAINERGRPDLDPIKNSCYCHKVSNRLCRPHSMVLFINTSCKAKQYQK